MVNKAAKPVLAEVGEAPRRGGRKAAGPDPVKRNQILDGAKRCFFALGFEAASMGEIAAEAGVSKGTLYVYFQNKNDLFNALIERERTALLASARSQLQPGRPLRAVLQRFGVTITTLFTSTEVIRAQRMVLGVAERMPEIAARFFGPEPFSGVAMLADFFKARMAAGELAMDDIDLAARQFMELAMAPIFKRRLFGSLPDPVPPEEVERGVASGVEVFLAYYGRGDFSSVRLSDEKSAG